MAPSLPPLAAGDGAIVTVATQARWGWGWADCSWLPAVLPTPRPHTHTHLPRSRSPWRPVQHRRNAARCLNVGTFNKCCIVFFISVHKQTTHTHMDGHTPPPHTHSEVRPFHQLSQMCSSALTHKSSCGSFNTSCLFFSSSWREMRQHTAVVTVTEVLRSYGPLC